MHLKFLKVTVAFNFDWIDQKVMMLGLLYFGVSGLNCIRSDNVVK